MEKKDFPKGTKPREIFVYTCERIAEPLIPLGYKYRKSKNDIYKKDGIFVFSFYFSPSIRFGSTTFTAFFDVSSPVIAQWRSEQEGTEETYDGIVGNRSLPGFPTCRSCWTMWNRRGSSPIGRGSMSLSGIGSSSNASGSISKSSRNQQKGNNTYVKQ